MKILTVCGLGLGTSLILKMSVDDVLRTNGVNADVEHCDVSSAKSMPCDYIITTSELAQSLEGQNLVIVENYIDKNEIFTALKNKNII